MHLSTWELALIILAVLPLVFLPAIIAFRKDHKYKIAITVISVLGVFLWGSGWIVSLVWCFIEPDKNSGSSDNPET